MQDLRYASATAQGRRPYNEDRYHSSHPLLSPLNPHEPCPPSFFAVFDGHGGEACVDYVVQHLPPLIASHPSYLHPPTRSTALEAAFLTLDSSLTSPSPSASPSPSSLPPPPPPIGTSGTTAGTLLIDSTHLYSANCGDTRTLLIPSPPSPPIPLTTDHKPTDPSERCRIEAAGGRVTVQHIPAMGTAKGGGGRKGTMRMVEQAYVEYGDAGLAVSRAFGDVGFKGDRGRGADEQVVVVRPSMVVRERRVEEDEFVVMASDGLWNFVSEEAVVEYVRGRLMGKGEGGGEVGGGGGGGDVDVEDVACKLVQLALDKKSNDNVTVTIVVFPRGMQLRKEAKQGKAREEEKKNEA